MADTDAAPAAQDPETLVSEIERTRHDLARTIDAIADRVSPAHVARRARQQAAERAGRIGRQLREQADRVDKRYAAAVGAAFMIGAAALLVWRVRR